MGFTFRKAGRIFGGKAYRYYNHWQTKTIANLEARRLRGSKANYKVRVVKTPKRLGAGYDLFVRGG